MYSVYQHWDPLKVCIVGRSYPPEFYSWIVNPAVRSLFEKIAIETEEDYQGIIKKLNEFGVEVLRPEVAHDPLVNGKFLAPPMTPRDYFVTVGDTFYLPGTINWNTFYNNVKDPSWPDLPFEQLPTHIQDECVNIHHWDNMNDPESWAGGAYRNVISHVRQNFKNVKKAPAKWINGAMVSRIGKDLFFGTEGYDCDANKTKELADSEFTQTRNHVINTGGHSDATYCPVCPGLIISLQDVPTYKDTFPGWEVVYLPGQSWAAVSPFLKLKTKNQGKWWIPGFEHDNDVVNVVETWLGHWTGYVEETVFDVNMLIIDPKNVMVFNYNKQVFDALDRYGITPHIVPFRHRYFWDGGIHCVTSDLHREGTMQDYFPGRR
jgi:hypothetical protein